MLDGRLNRVSRRDIALGCRRNYQPGEGASSVKTDGLFAALDNKCSLVPPMSALCLVSGQRLGPVNSSSYSAAHVPVPARPPQPRRRLSMIRTFWQKEWIILWLNILLSVLESVGPEIGDCEDGSKMASVWPLIFASWAWYRWNAN